MRLSLLILALCCSLAANAGKTSGTYHVPEVGKSPDPEMTVLSVEDRDGYECRYVEFTVEGKRRSRERVRAYLLIPDQASETVKCPAVLMLHDHGARFDIGKEKLVRPLAAVLPHGSDDHIARSSRQWVDKNFDGVWLADSMARQGYVVLAADALYWGERSNPEAQRWSELNYADKEDFSEASDRTLDVRARKDTIKALKTRVYEGQRKVYDDLFARDVIWAEKMLRDDIASVGLLKSLPYVDTENIGAFGFSMGAHRCWMLAAFCDDVKCGVALSWMTTLDREAEMSASDYSMAVMPMRKQLDFGDIGMFLSPKPMLFLNGETDHLFPKEKVEVAFEKLHDHYSENPGQLKTLFFDGGHHCGKQVQAVIADYLDENLKGPKYTNPVINADYSDPDICRVGDDYYMTSSSFNHFPGLQILHSTDLVNWELIGAALTDYPGPDWDDSLPWDVLSPGLEPDEPEAPGAHEWRTVPQHGCGVWAPAIRYHDGEFYIYCGDPDRGVFMVKTKDPAGKWDDPVWLVKAKGYIDPCPLWDSQGRAWLTHGCAGSRAGVKSVLFIAPMSDDGTRLLDRSRVIYDGHRTQPTIEGTKFYEYEGRYYIFSPAGGVSTGWQTVLRSDDPYGPYEEKVVMAQNGSPVNGPHQGGWIETASGEFWFMHFQDKDAYGRVVHLQPMKWNDGWPVIGEDEDEDGVGTPVTRYRVPDLPFTGVKRPADSDEFEKPSLGLQWQWAAVPSPYWSHADASKGCLRLYSVQQSDDWKNLWDSPNLLMQKFPEDRFTVTTKISFTPNPQLKQKSEACGLVVMGESYATLRLEDSPEGIRLKMVECIDADNGSPERVVFSRAIDSELLPVPASNVYMSTTVPPVAPLPYVECTVYFRAQVKDVPREGNVPASVCTFSYSFDGNTWHKVISDGQEYELKVRPGRWIGAKVGLYCNRYHSRNDSGWMESDWFRISY